MQKDLTNGFFDVKNQRFVRNKILQTPAILLDVQYIINKKLDNLFIDSKKNRL